MEPVFGFRDFGELPGTKLYKITWTKGRKQYAVLYPTDADVAIQDVLMEFSKKCGIDLSKVKPEIRLADDRFL